MTRWLSLTLFSFPAFFLWPTVGFADDTRNFSVDGIARFYFVHLPPQYDGVKKLPVVVFFHGGIRNAESARRAFGWNEKADKSGFIVVYPNGLPRRGKLFKNWKHLFWNSSASFFTDKADDVKFTGAVLEDLANRYAVDTTRVYATGVSHGAQMAYRVACELSGSFAAIAPAAGSLETAPCTPSRPVSVLDIHGTADPMVPYEGKGPLGFHSVPYSVSSWITIDGCGSTPIVTQMPDTAHDGTEVQIRRFPGCREAAEVTQVVVTGGGHTWPGMELTYPYVFGEFISSRFQFNLEKKMVGAVTHQFNATDYVWDFFSRH